MTEESNDVHFIQVWVRRSCKKLDWTLTKLPPIVKRVWRERQQRKTTRQQACAATDQNKYYREQRNKNHIFLHHNKKVSLYSAILLASKSKHTATYWLMMKSSQIIIVTLLISSIMKPLFSPVTNIMKWPSGCFKDYLVCILMLIYYISTYVYFYLSVNVFLLLYMYNTIVCC